MSSEHPERIGSCEILDVLATGVGGTLYKAFSQSRGHVVALRVWPDRYARDPADLESLQRDLDAVTRLRHPNIVAILETGQEENGTPYALMEYVDGGSLADRMAAGRLSLSQAIGVVRAVANGLAYAHRQRVAHERLSPRNILISRDFSEVKITGFRMGSEEEDWAQPSASHATAALANLSTLVYRAPEQVRASASSDRRADIYSLGVIGYEALTGTKPVGNIRLPSELNRQLPLQLDPIVLKCLASSAAQRYESMEAFLADLDSMKEVRDYHLISEIKRLSGGRLFGEHADAPRRRVRRSTARTWAYAVGIVLLALVIVALIFGFGRGSGTSSSPQAGASSTWSARSGRARPRPR